MRKVLFVGITLALAISTINAQAQIPTWPEDVAPLLQDKCMNCPRPGAVAPMSLLTYDEAQPWARSIRLMVQDRIMPPWHATPEYGEFGNNRRRTPRQIQTGVDWVEAIRVWVEEDRAPERLRASKIDAGGETTMTRPLCPYPQVAEYAGSGDTNAAGSFACVTP